MVELYVKCSGKECARCLAAEDKLRRLGVAYEKFCLEERLLSLHQNWREGSVERTAGWDLLSRPIPYIWFNEMGRGLDYPGAMKALRRCTKEVGR